MRATRAMGVAIALIMASDAMAQSPSFTRGPGPLCPTLQSVVRSFDTGMGFMDLLEFSMEVTRRPLLWPAETNICWAQSGDYLLYICHIDMPEAQATAKVADLKAQLDKCFGPGQMPPKPLPYGPADYVYRAPSRRGMVEISLFAAPPARGERIIRIIVRDPREPEKY